MLTEVLLLVLAMVLVAACGGFVAAEFAFVTVNRASVEADAERGDARSQGVLRALRSLSTQLSGAQVGITVTNLAIGFLAEPAIAGLIRGPLTSVGIPPGAVDGVAIAVALVLATGITMIFGELIPKNLAIARPLATARATQGFQRAFTKATAYLIRFFNGTANAILRLFGVQAQEELASARSPEELSALVRHSAREGTLEQGTAELLERSLAFGDRRARDAMTPRGQMRTLRHDATVDDLVRLARESGHARFPVLDAEDDGETVVTGVVHLKAGLRVPFAQRGTTSVAGLVAPPVVVPDTIELDELMDTLRGGGLQLAVLIDEYGDVAGLVTLEDLVEEIVGEVVDEHDDDEVQPEQATDGTWTLSGLMRVDEAGEVLQLDLPDDDAYETVAGLVTVLLGRLADVGDSVEVEAGTGEGLNRLVTLTVTAVDGLRVETLAATVREPEPDEPTEPSGPREPSADAEEGR